MYRLEVSPAAYHNLERLKGRIQRRNFERLRAVISSLADNLRPYGVRKIEGAERAYRLRIGDYRIVYEIYDKESMVLLLQVARRTEATHQRI